MNAAAGVSIFPLDRQHPSVVRMELPMNWSKKMFYSLSKRNDSLDVLHTILHGTVMNEQRRFLFPGWNAQRTLNAALTSCIIRLNKETARKTD